MNDRSHVRSLLSRLPRFEDLSSRCRDHIQSSKQRFSDFEQKVHDHVSKLGVPELSAFVHFRPILSYSFLGSGGFAKVYKVKLDESQYADYYAGKEIGFAQVSEVRYLLFRFFVFRH